MSWRENLRPASFRGAGFFVTEDDLTVGRRLQTHEYPQRDKPFTEDLGRKARDINITAYVIGDDYMIKRDALIKAIEEGGPGTLVHPKYGSMTVHAEIGRFSDSLDEGGICRLALTFRETGDLEFPSATSNVGAQTRLAADDVIDAGIGDFSEKFSLDGLPSFALDSALSSLQSGISGIAEAIGNASAGLSVISDLANLVSNPSLLAKEIFDLIDPAGLIGLSATTIRSQVSALLDLFDTHDVTSTVSTAKTSTRRQQATNTDAINSLVRHVALVNSAGMVTLITHPVFDDAEALRGRLVDAINSSRTKASDSLFVPLTTLKTSVVSYFMQETRQSARLRNVTPSQVIPAAVLAYQIYGDATRGDEIVTRNKIRHPGFLPVTAMKVLSK